MNVAYQALPSMGFSRHEYWSGLPFPSLEDLPNPGIEPASLSLAGRFFTTEPSGKPHKDVYHIAISIVDKFSSIKRSTNIGIIFICDRIPSDQIRSVAQLCPTLCNPMNRSTPGLPVHHQLPDFTQTHVHRVSDAIQPSHPLSSPSPPAPNPSQHQSLFQ